MSATTAGLGAEIAAAGSEQKALLAGRRILVTGVLTDRSFAYQAAERMQRLGADIVLTGFGRARRLTERAAQTLPEPPEVLELDVTEPGDYERLAEAVGERWEAVDGILHSVAYAPPVVWEQSFLEPPKEGFHEGLDEAMRASVYSFQALVAALLPQLRRSDDASVLTLTFTPHRVDPFYGWMHIVKSALDTLVLQLARELGPEGIRANALACGPVLTNAGRGIPQIKGLKELYEERAPLAWDGTDLTVAAGPICFMLSELSRRMTGEIVHVAGGAQAVL